MSKIITFNKPQLLFMANQPNSAHNVWGRASGKTFLIGWLIKMIMGRLPRSKTLITGPTLKALMENTLPSAIKALAMLGLERDKHYVFGRKAPKEWEWQEPIEPPLKYDSCFHFANGTVFQLISVNGMGTSARGLNADVVINDEALETDIARFHKEVSGTNRGNVGVWGKKGYHHGIFHFSSMPYANESNWLTDKIDYYESEFGEDILTLQNTLHQLQLEFIVNKKREFRLEIWQEIQAVNSKLKWRKNKEGFFYMEANAFDNILNVGVKYLENEYKRMLGFIFDIEILNKRPQRVEGGFYPYLKLDKHGYQNPDFHIKEGQDTYSSVYDKDCDPKKPLTVSVDWGSKISCLPVAQDYGSEYRFINALYVKHL